MAYTPNAEDTAQPTGNQALSTAALEFRTLKQYIQTTKTAQATATALVQTNLNTAVTTQDTRDDAQDSAITAAAALGTTGIANAAAALAVAQGKLTKVVLTGVGSWTVPDGVTSVLVIAQAGGSAQAEISAASYSFFSEATAGEVVTKLLSVTPGDVITYTCGAGQDLIRDPATGSPYTPCYIKTLTAAGQTNFGSSILAKAAVTRYAVNTAGYVTKDNSNYGYSGHYSGKLVDTRVANAAYVPDVSTIVAGTAGSITLLY
jgi:hypothetical protein